MQASLRSLQSRKARSRSGFAWLFYYLKAIFFTGPKLLLTSRISGKCALVMVFMCAPALLVSAILTLPEMIFRSPYQHAYYYFAQTINEDPSRWGLLLLSGMCSLMSLAVPATMIEPTRPIRY